MYMDRTYVSFNKKMPVYEMGLVVFRDTVARHEKVKGRLQSLLLQVRPSHASYVHVRLSVDIDRERAKAAWRERSAGASRKVFRSSPHHQSAPFALCRCGGTNAGERKEGRDLGCLGAC